MKINLNQSIYNILIVISMGMFCYACKNDVKEVEDVIKTNDDPNETSEDVELTFSDGGVIQMKMKAPLLEKYNLEDGNKLNWPKGIHVFFYDSVDVVRSELTSKKAHLLEHEKFMLVRDSVVFFNTDNEKLETEELQLFFDKDSIYTDKFVKISTKDGVIVGQKLISNLNFTKYKILTITDSYYNIEVEDENENDSTKQ